VASSPWIYDSCERNRSGRPPNCQEAQVVQRRIVRERTQVAERSGNDVGTRPPELLTQQGCDPVRAVFLTTRGLAHPSRFFSLTK
jgi:hypothetical protein